MSQNETSLLLRIRGDSSGGKAAVSEARAAVAELRQSFGPQLTQSVTVANQAFTNLGENLNNFVAQRAPLVGGAVVRVTDALKGLSGQTPKNEQALKGIADSIQSIASQSGKSVPQITSFLSRFVQLEGQAAKNEAAFKFFGGSVDLIGNKTAKFLPELEQTAGALAEVGGEGVAAGASIAGMAGPIGIAILAVAALAAAAVSAGREIFSITKQAAEFQGKMFDLAQQTGLAVKTLSALEVAATTTGGELGTITQAVVLFQRKLDDAQDPLSKTAEQFRKLGVDTSDTETALRSAFTALAAMPEGFAQTNAAAELFGGRGGKQVLAILKETNGDLDGTIKRLEQLGILISEDDARAADIFNDQLAELEFQTRALTAVFARDLIPAIADLARTTGGLITTLRPLISMLGSLTGSAVRFTGEQFKALSLIIQSVTKDYVGLARAIQEAHDAQQINPITIPDLRPVPLPSAPTPLQSSSDAVADADAVLAEVKRKAAQTNQALDEMFQRGRIDRQRQAESVIADNKRIVDAETARIDAELAEKEQEIKALDEAARNRGEIANRETEQYRAINAAVAKLQQERLDKENEFDVTSRALRAKAAQERANAQRNQIQNETDLLIKGLDQAAARAEAAIKRGVPDEEAQIQIIEKAEQEKLSARIKGLQDQKAVGFLTVQERKDLDNQIKALDKDREALADQQRERRRQREAEAAARNREVITTNLDAIIQQEQIIGERRIATLKALADQRVITEENAARQILAIRQALLDDEIAATEAKLTAAKSITDKDERVRVQTELNNQIKILTEQRNTIQADGDREVEEGRQRDLQNERRYKDELAETDERIKDIERDTKEEEIRLMVLHLARRKDIIEAQRKLDLADEEARHQRVTRSIKRQQDEVDEQIRIIESYLKSLKIGTTAEIEQYERLIKELEKLRIKRAELKAQQDAEDQRNATRKRRVTDESTIDLEREDPLSTRSLFGDAFAENFARFRAEAEATQDSVNNLAVAFSAAAQTAADFFHAQSEAAGNFATIAGGAIQTFTEGLKQMISAWVLTGETGPAALRKLTAQVLAQVAAQAAVKAIFELAEGFAMLFVDPAAAGAHFTAAAIYGSVAGVAAIAGRSVAGDLFKPKSSGAGAGGGREGSPQGLQTIVQGRNQPQTQIIRHEHVFRIQSNDSHIVSVFSKDFRDGGQTRELIVNDGGIKG